MIAISKRTFFYVFSLVIVGLAIVASLIYGIPVGIDFTGGSITEVRYDGDRPDLERVMSQLGSLAIGEFTVRPTGEDGYIVVTRDLSDDERQTLIALLAIGGEFDLTVPRFSSVGPTIGRELARKAIVALSIVLLATILLIAFTFRGVSKPVSSWKYGFVAIIALVHDVIIPIGVFAVLGRHTGLEVDALFVTALLAILGYSVNDTIVVLDRVRENLKLQMRRGDREPFDALVGRSLEQTFARSINMSVTVFLVLLTLFFFGGPTIHSFVLALIVGVVAGAYSSIFLAAPLLVTFSKSGRT